MLVLVMAAMDKMEKMESMGQMAKMAINKQSNKGRKIVNHIMKREYVFVTLGMFLRLINLKLKLLQIGEKMEQGEEMQVKVVKEEAAE